MAVKFEIKDQLARLLAQEDLIVEHKDVSTASFDVDRRVLVLPNWNKASHNVYDLLVGHEVGHALYTPNDDLGQYNAPQSYINVTEDARIEKLMKRRFPGLAKCFYRGYMELNDRDFFGIAEEDETRLALIDRINLYFKGNLDMEFSYDEEIFVERTRNLETFEDVVALAEDIHTFTQGKKKKKEKEKSDEEKKPNDPDLDTPSFLDSQDDFEKRMDELEDEMYNDEDGTDEQEGGGTSGELEEGITDDNLQDNIGDLSSFGGTETIYLQVPEIKTEHIVVPPEDVWEYFDNKTKEYLVTSIQQGYNWDPHKHIREEYKSFKTSAKREVNYLVKEFECRKSASAYARTTTSRTGVLDTTKLHTYRYNEDIFKKISVIPDGKNHGLIFILDWSGSMHNIIGDTVKQLLNLVWFCKKVNIPFEVYSFTNEWYRNCDDDSIPQIGYNEFLHQDKKQGDLVVSNSFNLLNVISSSTNTSDFEKHCQNLFYLAYDPLRYPRLTLSGTPLNESLVTLHSLIPEFRKKHRIEKLNTVILTDGEAAGLPYIVKYMFKGNEELGQNGVNSRCVLRDRRLGRIYNIENSWSSFTKALLTNLSEKFLDVNFIGIRLIEGNQIRRFLNHVTSYDYDVVDTMMVKWKKNKSFALEGMGYKKYFALSSNAIGNNGEFEVQEDATKAQIKKAFFKSRGAKKLNKKILSEFIDLVV